MIRKAKKQQYAVYYIFGGLGKFMSRIQWLNSNNGTKISVKMGCI